MCAAGGLWRLHVYSWLRRRRGRDAPRVPHLFSLFFFSAQDRQPVQISVLPRFTWRISAAERRSPKFQDKKLLKSEIQSNLEHQILRANVSQRSLTENEVLSRSSQCDSPAESTGRLEKRSLVVFFFSPFFDGNRSLSVSSLPGQCKRNVSRGEQNTSPFANSRGRPYPCARSLVRRSF